MKLSRLLQDVCADLGMTYSIFKATGGSTTTILDTKLITLDTAPEDNFAVNYAVFVRRDAGGAGAAPEGEFTRISAYNSTGGTFTLEDTLTAAVASGDEIFLANAEIPLRIMIWAANRALSEIGQVQAVPDTSLTVVANQTEYTLPINAHAGVVQEVSYQSNTGGANDNRWIPVRFKVVQGTYGSTGTLIIPQIDSGVTLRILYDGYHSDLTAYNSQIAESIPNKLMIAATSFFALRWYLNTNEGTEEFWRERFNEAGNDMARLLPTVRKVQRHIHGLRGAQMYPNYPGDSTVID